MQPTTGPNKAIAAGVSGALSVVLIWLIGALGVTVPAEVASALSALVATLFTWAVPHGGSA